MLWAGAGCGKQEGSGAGAGLDRSSRAASGSLPPASSSGPVPAQEKWCSSQRPGQAEVVFTVSQNRCCLLTLGACSARPCLRPGVQRLHRVSGAVLMKG